MPDVSSTAPEQVRLWASLDVHKHSIVAATLPPIGGTPQLQRIENTERAIVASATVSVGPTVLLSAMRPGSAALTCCDCSRASAWRAT